MNKNYKIFVLCYPHLGTLDNWLPVVDMVNNITNSLDFTLIIPNANIIRSFHRDNAVVKISDNIFNTVLINAYDDVWIKHASVFDSVLWYKNNRIVLRLFDILRRLIEKHTFFYILMRPLVLFRNKIYKKKYKTLNIYNTVISQRDILFYDIHTEGNHTVLDVLQLFESNNKYSLPHAISMSAIEQKSPVFININDKNNTKVYAYAKFQIKYYQEKYDINTNKIHVVGIPRHDCMWIKTVQEASSKLPNNFNDNTVVVLSRHVDSHLSFGEKVESIRNIKKIFIDNLNMRVAIKLHPNEKQERIFSSKKERIYENVFGLSNYGSTWIYSDLHVFALAKGKVLTISLYTGVVFDMVAMGIPCVEYINLLASPQYPEKKLSQFVKYGFAEGVSNHDELFAYVEKCLNNPDKLLATPMSMYKKYFPVFESASKKVVNEILHDNKIIN